MVNWVGTKKPEDNVKKDVDNSEEIVHSGTMTMSDALWHYKVYIGKDYENWTLGSKALLSSDNIS